MKFKTFICIILLSVGTVNAATYEGLEIEYSAGDEFAANHATIVIDFGLESYAFDYRWDGDATGWDALNAIDIAGELYVDATDWGGTWGYFVSDFDYLSASEYFYGDGVNAGWAYYLSDNGDDWAVDQGGVSFRTLTDGDWDCWLWSDYSADWMTINRTPGQLPVPEPAAMTLLALGGLLISRKKMR